MATWMPADIAGIVALGMLVAGWLVSRRCPAYSWEQWIRLPVFTAFCVLVTIFLKFRLGMKTNDAIVAVTGFVVLWYTLETYSLRWETIHQTKEMRAQRELQIRPFVVPALEDGYLVVRNVGHGAALGVVVRAIEETGPQTKRELEPDRIDVLASGKSEALRGRVETTGEVAFLFSGSSFFVYDSTIAYKNVEGRMYETRVRFGPGEYTVLGPLHTEEE